MAKIVEEVIIIKVSKLVKDSEVDVAQIANFEPVTVHAPYLASSKADILRDGLAMGLDYRHTWTCYEGQQLACGQCGSCRERLAAFAANQATDPLAYAPLAERDC